MQIPGKLSSGDDFRGGVVRAINGIIDYLRSTRLVGDNATTRVDQTAAGLVVRSLNQGALAPQAAQNGTGNVGNFAIHDYTYADGKLTLNFRRALLLVKHILLDQGSVKWSYHWIDTSKNPAVFTLDDTSGYIGFTVNAAKIDDCPDVTWGILNDTHKAYAKDFVVIGEFAIVNGQCVYYPRELGVPDIIFGVPGSSSSSSSSGPGPGPTPSSSSGSSSSSSGSPGGSVIEDSSVIDFTWDEYFLTPAGTFARIYTSGTLSPTPQVGAPPIWTATVTVIGIDGSGAEYIRETAYPSLSYYEDESGNITWRFYIQNYVNVTIPSPVAGQRFLPSRYDDRNSSGEGNVCTFVKKLG